MCSQGGQKGKRKKGRVSHGQRQKETMGEVGGGPSVVRLWGNERSRKLAQKEHV